MQERPLPESELSFQNVLEILEILKQSHWSEVEIEARGTSLKVTRSGLREKPNDGSGLKPVEWPDGSDRPNAKLSEDVTHDGLVVSGDPAKESQIDLTGMVAVKPPMAGIFYSAPAPGAAAFVAVGDSVRTGQQMGIVEVMKLFTPVSAPCSGTLRAILVVNEAFVQNDEVIMVIEPLEE